MVSVGSAVMSASALSVWPIQRMRSSRISCTPPTVRALRQLRDEGLLEFQRGRRIQVAGGAVAKSVVLAKAQELVQLARREGYRKDELLRLIDDLA